MAAKKQSFEEKLDALGRIANQLEHGEIPLEEMLKSFESGIKLYRECYEILNKAEAQVQILVDEMADDTAGDLDGGTE